MTNTEHILVLDSLKPFLSAGEEQTSHLIGHSLQLRLRNAVEFLNLLQAELSEISMADGEEDYAPTQQGWSLPAALIIYHGEVEQIHAEDSIIAFDGCQLQVLFNIPAACHSLDLKIQQDQDVTLHAQDLLKGVLPSAGLIVVPQFRDLDLLVLSSYEHCSYSQELVPASGYCLSKAVFINDEDCEVEGVRVVAQGLVDLHHPSHQGFSHGGSQLGLAGHEILGDIGFVLKVKSMGVYLLQVRLHFGQRLQPLGSEGGSARLLLGLFGRLGFGEIGEIEAEGAGGVSGLNGAGLRRSAHSLNLTLTAISKKEGNKSRRDMLSVVEVEMKVLSTDNAAFLLPLISHFPSSQVAILPPPPYSLYLKTILISIVVQYSKMSTQAGGLIGILRNLRKNKKQQLRILVLGLDNSGKTTILKSLSNQDISTITPTQGFNIKNLTHDRFKLNVWDIGGQKALREYWGNYFTNTDALIYVIDSADTKRVKEAGEELEKLLLEKDLANVPVLVFANKQDLVQALQPDEILNNLKIENFGGRKWTIVACSAKTQEGLEDGLTWLVENVKK